MRPILLARPSFETVTLRIHHRSEHIIVATWVSEDATFYVLVSQVDAPWLLQFCPWLATYPGVGGVVPKIADAQTFLDECFGTEQEQIATGPAGRTETWARASSATGLFREMSIEWQYRGLDAICLLRGFAPREMEEHWRIRTVWQSSTEGRIQFIRSWTGILVWEAMFRIEGDVLHVTSLRVNLDREAYGYQIPAIEEGRFASVVAGLIPNGSKAWPDEEVPPGLATRQWRAFPVVT